MIYIYMKFILYFISSLEPFEVDVFTVRPFESNKGDSVETAGYKWKRKDRFDPGSHRKRYRFNLVLRNILFQMRRIRDESVNI